MTRSEMIGQLRQLIMLEGDPENLSWWHLELTRLARVAEQRAADTHCADPSDEAGSGAPPPFVGTG